MQPSASPLCGITEEEAEWIRTHVWTGAMRKTFRDVPGHYTACACQYGATQACRGGQHDRCHRVTSQIAWATVICGRDGVHPLLFAEDYKHPCRASATGPHPTALPLVWLADRTCRWVCDCTCHTEPAPPVQLDLLQEVRAW
ncbi:DUF6248 family natural product biosynthesis protein [Thermomonospora cellulosilytica]|uniref:Uncharacterized protein n=1 Tax=Thermomonospora cellulosilytica TaxID=1411118 RepID=A0A7W3N1L4_9ACTN|nr:DUF6248 family natural product biosynthesis protein [Thermomonospora cellulosilytica]MBA9005855.1 hypothetical protein [Thermomonospora cellulosilytica]